jgi:hypothetical protein
MTHTDLINLWPSLSVFADDLSIEYGTAKAMRRRNSIPPAHWVLMVDKAKARKIRGVTEKVLALAVAAPSKSEDFMPAPLSVAS